jgi:hypothetical protein
MVKENGSDVNVSLIIYTGDTAVAQRRDPYLSLLVGWGGGYF